MATDLCQTTRSGERAIAGRRWRPGRPVRRGWIQGLLVVAVLAATGLRADCAAEPARIVELDLSGCRPAALVIDEQVAGSTVWWLAEYMSAIARQVPGVVVRGAVGRQRRFEPPQTLGPWEPGSADEEYFFPSLDPEFCSTFEPLESILLVIDVPCCDVIPPADVACLLRLPQARSPTPLERQLSQAVPE